METQIRYQELIERIKDRDIGNGIKFEQVIFRLDQLDSLSNLKRMLGIPVFKDPLCSIYNDHAGLKIEELSRRDDIPGKKAYIITSDNKQNQINHFWVETTLPRLLKDKNEIFGITLTQGDISLLIRAERIYQL